VKPAFELSVSDALNGNPRKLRSVEARSILPSRSRPDFAQHLCDFTRPYFADCSSSDAIPVPHSRRGPDFPSLDPDFLIQRNGNRIVGRVAVVTHRVDESLQLRIRRCLRVGSPVLELNNREDVSGFGAGNLSIHDQVFAQSYHDLFQGKFTTKRIACISSSPVVIW
jgi:hypothetical protein